MVGTHLRGVPYLVLYLGRLGEPSLPKDGGRLRDLLCQRGLGGRQTRDGDAEWTATDVVEPEPVTEFY
jgi:hypothetical protein